MKQSPPIHEPWRLDKTGRLASTTWVKWLQELYNDTRFLEHIQITDGNPHGTDWDMLESTASYIPLNVTPTGVPTQPGTLSWNVVDGTVDMQLLNNTTLQTGQEMYFYGKAIGAVANGDLIEFAGVQGDHVTFRKAIAVDIIANPHYLMGVATQNIANNEYGYVTAFGKINGVYTTGWTVGDILYFDSVTGQLTNVLPSAPNPVIRVAVVVKEATGASENGIILVRPTFSSKLTALDDVDGNPLTKTGQILIWDQTNGYWNPSINVTINDTTRVIETNTEDLTITCGAAKTVVLSTTVTDDVYPSSVTVAVGAAAPSFTAYNGGLKAYEFTGVATNKELQVGYQIYHSYAEGTNVIPHLHLTFTSGGADAGNTIIFDLEYEWQDISSTGAYSTATVQGTLTIGANSTIYRNSILSFGSITGTGKKISSTFMTRLVRRQDLDTFTGSCWLLSADLHISKDTIGSRQTGVK